MPYPEHDNTAAVLGSGFHLYFVFFLTDPQCWLWAAAHSRWIQHDEKPFQLLIEMHVSLFINSNVFSVKKLLSGEFTAKLSNCQDFWSIW